jgi:hypothetical protein
MFAVQNFRADDSVALKGYYYFSSLPNTKAPSVQDLTNKLTLHTIRLSKILDVEMSQD